jgi:hypothetical protein
MAEKLNNTGTYRILYAQPTPETGERIAVAVVVQENHRTSLYFDRQFPRLKKVLGDLELDALEYYLEDLRRALFRSGDPESVLNTFAPQIVPSDARKVSLPLSETALRVLLQKLLQPSPRLTSAPEEAVTPVDPVSKAIEAYVRVRAGVTADIQANITPAAVFGRDVPGLHSVAVGVKRGSSWVLVDGVDLNGLTPKRAIKRADEVARNFWQFSREAARLPQTNIKRIGLVLNGNSHRRQATLDAHDYSLHRLSADADWAVDGSSVEAPDVIKREVLAIDE